jgi:hypothetical protein
LIAILPLAFTLSTLERSGMGLEEGRPTYFTVREEVSMSYCRFISDLHTKSIGALKVAFRASINIGIYRT